MGAPLWLRAFSAVEGAVAPRLEEIVHGDGFSRTLVRVQNVKRGVRGHVERRTRQVWHVLNLPAGSDVRLLRGAVGDLDHEVRALRSSLEREARERSRREAATAGERHDC